MEPILSSLGLFFLFPFSFFFYKELSSAFDFSMSKNFFVNRELHVRIFFKYEM